MVQFLFTTSEQWQKKIIYNAEQHKKLLNSLQQKKQQKTRHRALWVCP